MVMGMTLSFQEYISPGFRAFLNSRSLLYFLERPLVEKSEEAFKKSIEVLKNDHVKENSHIDTLNKKVMTSTM